MDKNINIRRPKLEINDPEYTRFFEEKRKQKDWPTNPEPYSGAFATYKKETRYLKFDGIETYLMGYDGYTGDALLKVTGKKGEWVIPVPQEELYRQNQYVAEKVAELEDQSGHQDDESVPAPDVVIPNPVEDGDFDEDDQEVGGENDEEQPEGDTEEEEEELRQMRERVKKFEQLNEKIHAYTIETLQNLNIPLSEDIDLKKEIHNDMMANLDQIKSEGTYSEKTPTVQKIADKQIGNEVLAYAEKLDDTTEEEFDKEMGLSNEQGEFDEIVGLFEESGDKYKLSPEKTARLGELFRSKSNIPNIDGTLPKKPATTKPKETDELPEDIKTAIETEEGAPAEDTAKDSVNPLKATDDALTQALEDWRMGDKTKNKFSQGEKELGKTYPEQKQFNEKEWLQRYLAKYRDLQEAWSDLKTTEVAKDEGVPRIEEVHKEAQQDYEKKLDELTDLIVKEAPRDYAYDIDTVRRRFTELNGYEFDPKSGRITFEL